ncbi:hypothetical protein CICLE_v10013504mg [Citrus x clementina]|uniref:Bifunctional inhibitor/plant lipid transfer protein/seed storage helical domain-containing protein n=1 Tax=Citrus clementina TaxID=85681 RepID=V4UT77_CITCL|nr:hypothetical protein CICLE_v10013504mg [Citrus x clementina]
MIGLASSLSSCIPYLRAGGSVPPACSGVKSLNAAANTTPNRQATRRCLKSAPGSILGVNYALAAGLPSE